MRTPRAVAVVIADGRVLIVKRYLRNRRTDVCAMCEDAGSRFAAAGSGFAAAGRSAGECPGHHYAVLPGGHVEPGETAEEAALRELAEETTLGARIDRLLWTGRHNQRPATYFLMTDVVGTPVLGGEEADENCADNSFELLWAAAGDFGRLGLHPAAIHEPLAGLLSHDSGAADLGAADLGAADSAGRDSARPR